MKKAIAIILSVIMVLALAGCGGSQSEAGTAAGTTDTAAAETVAETKTELAEAAELNAAQEETEAPEEEVTYKKDIVIGLAAKINSLDPQSVDNVVHSTASWMNHARLLRFDWNTKELTDELATEWSCNDAADEWTFKLRDDVNFTNGEPFTAADVIYTYERAKESGTSTAITSIIDGMEAVSDYELKIKLNQSNVDIIYKLAQAPYSILNKKAIDEDPEEGFKVGCGGWIVDSWESGNYVQYKKYEDSWIWKDEQIPTETIRLVSMMEDSARVVAVQTGESQLGSHFSMTEIPALNEDENLKTTLLALESIYFLGFNADDEKLADPNMRLAIAYAINVDELNDLYLEGNATPCKTLWGNSQYGYYDDYDVTYDFDLEKAKEYLAKTQYADGVDLELVTDAAFSKPAEIIQAQLKQIGINVTINGVDTAGLNETCEKGAFDLYFYNKSCGPEGDNFRNLLVYGQQANRCHYNNKEVEELLDKAVGEPDDTARKEMYKEVQEITHEELPYLPLFYGVETFVYDKDVSGLRWASDYKMDYSHMTCTE